MLLDRTTIDACFLSSQLHIRTGFQFFLICLGAFLLVVSLEFLRRLQRSFDSYLRAKNALLQESDYIVPEEMTQKVLGRPNITQLSHMLTNKRYLVILIEQILRGLIHSFQFASVIVLCCSLCTVTVRIVRGVNVSLYANYPQDTLSSLSFLEL